MSVGLLVLLVCLTWFDAVLLQNVVSLLGHELPSLSGDRLTMLSPFRHRCLPFPALRRADRSIPVRKAVIYSFAAKFPASTSSRMRLTSLERCFKVERCL